jgi:acyl-CoA oxidase
MRYVAAHSGELLSHGRLTADQVRELPDVLEAAVGALEPHALTLTEAFAVLGDPAVRPMLQSGAAADAVPV